MSLSLRAQQLSFVASGVAISTVVQEATYRGLGQGRWVFVMGVMNYLGMLLVSVPINGTEVMRELTAPLLRASLLLSVFDSVAQLCAVTSIRFMGSGLFSVFYGIIPIITSVMGRFMLGHVLSRRQVLSMLVVCAALASIPLAEGNILHSTQENPLNVDLLIGVGFSLIGTTLSASVYILIEWFLKKGFLHGNGNGGEVDGGSKPKGSGDDEPKGGDDSDSKGAALSVAERRRRAIGGIGFASGVFSLLLLLIGFTVTAATSEAGEDDTYFNLTVGALLLALLFANGWHTYAFLCLLGISDSTSTGILQSIRAVFMYGWSAVLYCSVSKNQCWTPLKTMACFAIIVGVSVFMSSKRAAQRSKGEEIAHRDGEGGEGDKEGEIKV